MTNTAYDLIEQLSALGATTIDLRAAETAMATAKQARNEARRKLFLAISERIAAVFSADVIGSVYAANERNEVDYGANRGRFGDGVDYGLPVVLHVNSYNKGDSGTLIVGVNVSPDASKISYSIQPEHEESSGLAIRMSNTDTPDLDAAITIIKLLLGIK